VNRDAANTDWQHDLIVSLVKIGDITGEKAYAARALDVALDMQRRGTLAPQYAGMVEDLKRRAGQ
jgi:hypothetical protein